MTRHEEREQAFLLLFEMTFGEEPAQERMESATEARGAEFTPFAESLVNGVTDTRIQIDDRLAAYEMLYCEDIPDSVAINEAVELVKAYGGEEDSAFVNGVLGGLSRAGETETVPV